MDDTLHGRVRLTHEGVERRGALRLFGFELEGESYWYLLTGALVSLLSWIVLSRSGLSWLPRGLLAGVPLVGACAWLRVFVMGRPPAYQSDVFEAWLGGEHLWQVRRTPVLVPTLRPIGRLSGKVGV